MLGNGRGRVLAWATAGLSVIALAMPTGATGAAEVTLQPQALIGSSGHAGLYGWGAATMKDGSILVGDYWNMRVLRFAEDGSPLGAFIDNAGFGATQHQAPYGLAVDPDNGDVYMADTDRYQVDRYSSSGVYLNSLGTNGVNGETPSTFRYPSRVAVNDGLVFIADTWSNRISVWKPTGTEQLFELKGFGAKDGQLKQPRGMSFDAKGRLHVADGGNKRVQVFGVDLANKKLTFLYKYGSPYVAGAGGDAVIHGDMRGLAVDKAAGFSYVVDGEGNRIHKFTVDGTYVKSWGGSSTFSDGGREATVDRLGRVWVGDMPGFRVQVFSAGGNHLFNYPNPPQPPPPGRFNGPRGVAVDPKTGNIFVSDTYNFRIQKLAPNGSMLTQWGTRGRAPYEFNYTRLLAVDPRNGSVIVCDTDNHRIKKYDANGVFQWEIGEAGPGQLQFKNPHGIDIGPDGTIYVADTNNGRVQVINADGTFRRFVGSLGTGNGQFRRPRGVVADDVNGDIYVSDSLRQNVQVFSAAGAYLRTIGAAGTSPQPMDSPFDVEVDDEFVFVADSSRNTIAVWRKNGQWMGEYGGGGGALGKLLQPQGLDLVGNTLYIAEQTGERISKWKVVDGTVVQDVTAPASSQSSPAMNASGLSRPVTIAGTASDNMGVAAVQVAVRDRVSGLWWNPSNGSWQSAISWGNATLGAAGSSATSWSSVFNDQANKGSGQYFVQHRPMDSSGNLGPVVGSRFSTS